VAYLLYKLSFASGKDYIGQTVRSMNIRLAQHRTAANRGSLLAVHCAWRKHGEPSVLIIGEYETPEELHAAEIAAIRDCGTISPGGYNVGLGGETAASSAPLVRAKIAEKARGRKIDNTPRRKEIARELWQSEDYRTRQSEAQRAAWDDPQKRAERSAVSKAFWAKRKAAGWVMPEETKAKLKGQVRSDESRAKMSVSAKNRGPRPAVSEETRRKLSERAKEAWQNPEVTARRVAAIKASAERNKQGADK
jgi:hypothetical protein